MPTSNASSPGPLELVETLAADRNRYLSFVRRRVRSPEAHHGLSASAAGVRVHRARKALLERVQDRCGACAGEGCLDCTCQRTDAGCST